MIMKRGFPLIINGGVLRRVRLMSYKILILPGDGIGPEVMQEVDRVINWFNKEVSDCFIKASSLNTGTIMEISI